MLKLIKKLEKEKLSEMEHILQSGYLDVDKVVHLFSNCTEEEIAAYA